MQEMDMIEVEAVSGGMGSRGYRAISNPCNDAIMGGFIGGGIAGMSGGLLGMTFGAIGGSIAGYISVCN